MRADDQTEGRLTALVLGVGGNVSQGILKALAISGPRPRVIAACVDPLAPGLYAADRAYISPFADDPAFVAWVVELCERDGVDAVFSGVEPVLAALSPHAAQIRERTGAVVVTSAPECLAVGADKLRTATWLAEAGLHFPRTARASDADAVKALIQGCGYPLIAKPRFGKGAHGVLVVDDQATLAYACSRPEYVIQQHLGTSADEYTVGCFSDLDGRVRGSLVMRRQLQDGTTVRASIVNDDSVRAEAVRVVSELRPIGPCNVQMRVHEDRPTTFELNIRFSGTAPARARLGFNEVEAALRHLVVGENAVELPQITEGLIVRYWNEMYVDPTAQREVADLGRLDDPRASASFVEDWGMR